MLKNNAEIAAGKTQRLTLLNRMPRFSMALVMAGLLAVGTVVVGPRAAAQSPESHHGCTNRMLRGSYAFAIDGTVIAGPNRLLLRGVAMTEFDGEGNLTQVDFTTVNGAAGSDWRPGTGSYEVNPDCTGSMQIVQSDGSPTLNMKLVVADRGRTVYNMVLGSATGATGTKVD